MLGFKSFSRASMRIGAICVLLMPLSAPVAMAGQSLSLSQAIDSAFAMNPDLAAARREIGIAEGDRVQAGLIPNPVVSWEKEDTRRNTSTTTVLLSQALELGGKRGARIEVATRGQDAARLELERRSNELRAEVTQAFMRRFVHKQAWISRNNPCPWLSGGLK